jgi:Sulfotransferase family
LFELPRQSEVKMQVIFIASLSHSGSTLLDLMLNAHPQLMSVGELMQLNRYARFEKEDPSCTCGRPSLWDCDFWSAVNEITISKSGKTLAEINVKEYKAREDFKQDNVIILRALATVSGKQFIVDSSKSYHRLKLLLDNPEIDVFPILLLREPKGQVCSMLRKQKHKKTGLFSLIRNYVATNDRIYSLIKDRPHVVLRYEQLIANPKSALDSLMQGLGLNFDEAQLNWATQKRHNIGGNAMRRCSTNELTLDEGWRQRLSFWQKAVIDVYAWTAVRHFR